MARPSGEKTRCNNRWTEARFKSFIKSLLRSGTQRWAPIQDCLKAARTRRGYSRCEKCLQEVPNYVKDGGRRKKNVVVDHIEPAVPVTGWESWDHLINSMFCEGDNLQALCLSCHDKKSAEEREERKLHKKKEV